MMDSYAVIQADRKATDKALQSLLLAIEPGMISPDKAVEEIAQTFAAHVAPYEALREAFLPETVSVMDRMSVGYGYPAADMADDLGLSVERVKEILRALKALGLADHHKFFSEDDSYIRGSGYSLNYRGERVRKAIDALLSQQEASNG